MLYPIERYRVLFNIHTVGLGCVPLVVFTTSCFNFLVMYLLILPLHHSKLCSRRFTFLKSWFFFQMHPTSGMHCAWWASYAYKCVPCATVFQLTIVFIYSTVALMKTPFLQPLLCFASLMTLKIFLETWFFSMNLGYINICFTFLTFSGSRVNQTKYLEIQGLYVEA